MSEKDEFEQLKAENEYLRELSKFHYECSEFYRDERDKLKAENARLRDELAKARDPQRIGGQADPNSFVYAIEQLREFRWQHATNDEDAIPYINNVAAAHERENAKLRKLVRDMWHLLFDWLFKNHEVPWKELEAAHDRMRELGVDE